MHRFQPQVHCLGYKLLGDTHLIESALLERPLRSSTSRCSLNSDEIDPTTPSGPAARTPHRACRSVNWAWQSCRHTSFVRWSSFRKPSDRLTCKTILWDRLEPAWSFAFQTGINLPNVIRKSKLILNLFLRGSKKGDSEP